MRLTHIKLSGFKSFVDPTTIPTPSQMVAVVGPNGCGKSNIMDAVRWVLGESRVSELRGESMQDVIFNGSGNRKPAGRASVELVFDNSDGKAAGQWSSYSEIAVRRILTKDNQSSYLINNQQVRRKDIHDLFLGTGLGARGYAIIGQGMINRLIEAKPDELRVYLEEAAGVSRYKERRRETENRLSSTRDNLQRVEDILRELNKQLERLEAQAEVAQRYRQLQEEGLDKQHYLWFLRERKSQEEFEDKTQAIDTKQKELDGSQQALQDLDSQLTARREAVTSAGEVQQRAQSAVYTANAAVQRIETEIRHAADSRQRIEERRSTLHTHQDEWRSQLTHADEQIETLTLDIEEVSARIEMLRESAEQTLQKLPDQQASLESLRGQKHEHGNTISDLEKKQALLKQRLQQLTQQDQQQRQKQQKLQSELNTVPEPDRSQLQELEDELKIHRESIAETEETLQLKTEQLPEFTEARDQIASELAAAELAQTQLQSRLDALIQLQQEVLRSSKNQPWLQSHQLDSHARLFEQLQIEPGWEPALEAALRDRLNAVELPDLDLFLKPGDSQDALPPGRLAFYLSKHDQTASPSQYSDLKPLASLITSSNPAIKTMLSAWLDGFFIADSLQQCLKLRETLQPGQKLILREGHLADCFGVVFYSADNHEAGALARQQEIKKLETELRSQEIICGQIRPKAAQADADLQTVNTELENARRRLSELNAHQHSLQLDHSRFDQEIQEADRLRQRLQADLSELSVEQEETAAGIEDINIELETLEAQLEEAQNRFEDIADQEQQHSASYEQLKAQSQDAQQQLQSISYDKKTLQSRLDEYQRNKGTASKQIQQIDTELHHLEEQLFEFDEDDAQQNLQDAREEQAAAEETLRMSREDLEATEAAQRQVEEERMKLEQTLTPAREAIMQLRLDAQAAELAVQNFAEQLDAHEVDREALQQKSADYPEDWHKVTWLQSEIQKINRQITALGAVNLAALEELEEARTRKGFLDEQEADLQEAIDTLEAAIQKIDRETRSLLSDTFKQVNEQFSALFPQLFGGGEAKLIMTGEEILDAGVQVMAQPPGKKNSSIHLLSGGEKALTAIALVFAFFKLNPAPFCLLDEVDAPLDDANTDRYARLVESMSEHTQFLYISHNKIAMKMAKQLVGVTMQEQGVSRIVAVDVETAVKMAQQ